MRSCIHGTSDYSFMAALDSTCWTIIRSAASGNSDDRNHFVHRYESVIRSYLVDRWRTSPCITDLDDAVQEVFVECFRNNGVLERADKERPGGFRAFLFGVIRNVARRVEAGKKRNRIASPGEEFAWEEVPGQDTDQAFDRSWTMAMLWEAAQVQARAAQQNDERAVKRVELLHLRFYKGLPIREIARLWQADPVFLHHEYARAREEFKEALQEVIAFHEPGSKQAVDQAIAVMMTCWK
jgi:RNA polymerase sigma factor (sigma-70 family)